MRLALVTAALALAATACGTSSGAGAGAIDATLDDTSIRLSSADIGAGAASFHVSNAGTKTHEFEVFEPTSPPTRYRSTTVSWRATGSGTRVRSRTSRQGRPSTST